MSIVYSADAETFYHEDPEQVANDYISQHGCDWVLVYIADAYNPDKGSEEHDVMIAEEWAFMVRNIRQYKKYLSDELNDWVKEINGAGRRL